MWILFHCRPEPYSCLPFPYHSAFPILYFIVGYLAGVKLGGSRGGGIARGCSTRMGGFISPDISFSLFCRSIPLFSIFFPLSKFYFFRFIIVRKRNYSYYFFLIRKLIEKKKELGFLFVSIRVSFSLAILIVKGAKSLTHTKF